MSRTDADYIPGCYRNLESFADESLTGYLLRLAQSNGYPGIRALLRGAGLLNRGSLRPQLLKLHADRARLAYLSRMAVGDAGHLERYFSDPLPPPTFGEPMEAIFRLNRRVDIDALLPERTPVCIQCLRENGYLREEWDLAPVTVCVVHKLLLVDECPTCHSPLTWERPQISYCGHCLHDLRELEAAPASEDVTSVIEDFAALAPFRMIDHHGQTYVVDWDEMFKACKALLLPDHLWAAGEFPRTYVAQTTLTERQKLIEQLANAHSNARYDMSEVSVKARQAFAPFSAIPVPTMLEDSALHYLETEVGLSRDLAAALVRHDPARNHTAIEIFGDSPPSIGTPEELCDFLNASAEDVACLLRQRVIRPISKATIAYDADDIIRARQYLDSLVRPEGLSRLLGVGVTSDDLKPNGLFPRWNPRSRTDNRVAPERIVELQRDLTVLCHSAETPKDPVSVRSLIPYCLQPFEMVTAVVKHISMRTIKRFVWEPPFTWSDIVVDRSDLGAVSGLLS